MATRALAILASVLLHAGVTAMATRLAPEVPAHVAMTSSSLEIDFSPIEDVPEPEPAPPLGPTPPAAPTDRRSPPVPPQRPTMPPPAIADSPPTPPALSAPPSEAEVTRAPATISLDPRHLSRSLLGIPAVDPRPTDPSASTDDAEPDAREVLNEHLRARANAGDYLSDRRPPELRRLPDGGYRLVGSRLNARIHPDGSVFFGDRGGVDYAGERSQALRLSFDLGSRADERHGNDLLRTERAWFMRGTEELRARLEAEAATELGEASARRLRGRLEGIWNADELSSEEMRRRVFRVWDACSERGEGAAARRSVEAFARERFPLGSERAFGVVELRTLNEGRRSRSPFSPYGG